jgi:HPt (histidine-containing phosphotransfer) domain-containing protein
MQHTFKVVDLTYLNSIADGNQEIIKELIEIFIDQLPEFTDGFSECMNKGDWAQLAALAHKAKSSVMSMGMTEIGNIDLKNLELLSKNRRISELETRGPANDKETKELDTLRKNLQSYPPDRQEWVFNNDKDDTIKQIIDKFVRACNIAREELNSVIGA